MNIAKKTTLAASVVTILSITTCSAIQPVFGDFRIPETQTITSDKPAGILEDRIKTPAFKRIEAEIVELEPWLKPENKSLVLSDQELISILREVGFSGDGLRMAWAIVKKESSSRPYAHNDNRSTGDNSYGLFQINMIDSLGPARLKLYDLQSNEELFDPRVNASVAFRISSGGKKWGAWTTREAALSLKASFPS